MDDPVKLCKDCKHLLENDRCGRDRMPPDYVHGKPQQFFPAQAVRQSANDCGPQAKWFEPRKA